MSSHDDNEEDDFVVAPTELPVAPPAPHVKQPMSQARLEQLAHARACASVKRKQRATDKRASEVLDAAERLLAQRQQQQVPAKQPRSRHARAPPPVQPEPSSESEEASEDDDEAYRAYHAAAAEKQERAHAEAMRRAQQYPTYGAETGQIHEHLKYPAF